MKVDDNAFLLAAHRLAYRSRGCTSRELHQSGKIFSRSRLYGRDAKLAIDGLGGSYGVERLTYYKMLPQMGPPETTVFEYPGSDDSWANETRDFDDDINLGREPSPGLGVAGQVGLRDCRSYLPEERLSRFDRLLLFIIVPKCRLAPSLRGHPKILP